MRELAVIRLSLAACLAAIGVAGVRLSRYGDIIAEKSGLAIVGLVLRPQSRVLRSVSWISVLLLVVYLLNTLFLYLHGH